MARKGVRELGFGQGSCARAMTAVRTGQSVTSDHLHLQTDIALTHPTRKASQEFLAPKPGFNLPIQSQTVSSSGLSTYPNRVHLSLLCIIALQTLPSMLVRRGILFPRAPPLAMTPHLQRSRFATIVLKLMQGHVVGRLEENNAHMVGFQGLSGKLYESFDLARFLPVECSHSVVL